MINYVSGLFHMIDELVKWVTQILLMASFGFSCDISLWNLIYFVSFSLLPLRAKYNYYRCDLRKVTQISILYD